MTSIKNNLFIFCLFFFITGNENFLEWSSLTSSLNSLDLSLDSDGNIIGATSGGILKINQNENLTVLNKNLNLVLIKKDFNNLIWVAEKSPNGNISVYDSEYNLIYNSNYLEIESIIDFCFFDSKVFAIYKNGNDIGLLEFNYENNIPFYIDYYNDFPEDVNIITDIDIYENKIYVTTDKGIFRSDFIVDNLKFSSSWVKPSYGIDEQVIYFNKNIDGSYLVTSNKLYLNNDNFSNLILEFDNEIPLDIFDSNNLIFCTTMTCYEIDSGESNIFYISDNVINSFYKLDNLFFIAIKNGGVLSVDYDNAMSKKYFVPNTILQNKYDAITVLENGSIAAVSKSNGFIYDGATFSFFISNQFSDLLPVSLLNDYMNEGEVNFKIIDYVVGDKMIWSIIENEFNNIMFSNSGIVPSVEDNKAGIIEINTNDFSAILYDTSRTEYMNSIDYPIGVLDGLYGISNENTFDSYMVTHQLKKDNENNIWVTTPYSEQYNHIASVQLYSNNQQWTHLFSDNNSSYFPTEIAFDKYNRGWVGFGQQDTWVNSDINTFSKGGIRIFNHMNSIYSDSIQDSSNVVWMSLSNPDELPNGENSTIWSLDMGFLGEENILWILTPQGGQGYILNGLELIKIYPLLYYSNLSFQKGDKIRVDSQNNAWITTRDYGARVIKNDATLWPSGEGFTSENSELLSNIIYDISFNDIEGKVYFSTENGISILETPFSVNNSQLDKILISPQPYVIPNDEYMYIRNLISGSNVKIVSLSGNVLNEFNLDYNENILKWNGRDRDNNLLSTGIYYISSYKNGNAINSKIAIVRE